MNTYQPINNPVGKTVANWNPAFANWIQLAKPCQLKTQQPCGFSSSWQLATEIEFANLPTDGKSHGYWLYEELSVGENSPLPTGEVATPDMGRSVNLVLEPSPVVYRVGVEMELTR